MLDLRPLSLGEIVDRSASLWRANWKPLFKLTLGFQLGEFALLKAWELITGRYFPIARGGQRMIEALQSEPQEALWQLAGSLIIFGVMALIYLLTGFFSGIAATTFAWAQMIGRTATLREALHRALDRLRTTLGFFGLMLGWTLIVAALLVLPGAAMMIAAAAFTQGAAQVALMVLGALWAMAATCLTVLWFALRFLLASQVLALEEAGALGAFQRCGALSSGRVGEGLGGLVKVRLSVTFTVVAVILLAVSLVFGMPALIIQGIYANPLDPLHATPDAVPQLLLVPAQLLQVIAQSVVGPLFVIFGVVFYADMRVRREGLDLEFKLNQGEP